MRVTTDLWVSALVRRTFSGGGFAAVARRGALEAGAVMLVLRDRMGGLRLFMPAPQAIYDDSRPDERRFVEVADVHDDEALSRRVERETRFDTDVWLVELDADAALFEQLVEITTP